MGGLLFLVKALGLLGPPTVELYTTCGYYTRDVYVKVMAGITILEAL
jgi:hypothetical protein